MLWVILMTGLFSIILIWFTAATQGIQLVGEDWVGLPLLVIFVISFLGVLLLDDHFRG